AILSGLALCGVAGSLLLQHRQTKLERIAAARERHFDLVKLGLDDPFLRPPGTSHLPAATSRQWAYINLWVNYWAMLWDTGTLTDVQLRALLDTLFRDEQAHDWWTASGPMWATHASGRTRTFQEIANLACRHAQLTRAAKTERPASRESSSPPGNAEETAPN